MAETALTAFVLILCMILLVLKLITGGSKKRFFVSLAGQTNNAHQDFINKLKGFGHTEVFSAQGCDYVVAFCPVASRVGTDVSEALNKVSGDKPTILVVMHHTFDRDHVVADSKRLVNNPNILTVDCLFWENHFLKSKLNDAAWGEIQKNLGISVCRVYWQKCCNFICCDSTLGWVFWAILVPLTLGMYTTAKVVTHLTLGSE